MRARVLVDFICPFCMRDASAIEVEGMDGPENGALHDAPPCDTFTRLSVVDYLAAVNRAYGLIGPMPTRELYS